MKKHKITKRFFALAICLCMIFTMMPMAAHATETQETYTVYLNSSGGSGTLSGDGSYAVGTTVTITATPADGYCLYMWGVSGSTVTLAGNKATTTTFTMPASDVSITANFRTHSEGWGYTEDEHYKTCLFCGEVAGTRASHSYTDDTDTECECGWTREVHTHDYSDATCTTPATCSCGETSGGVDKSNHVGGTEIRNAKNATETEDGYTGDTYCKGCGDKLSDGETIPATHQHTWEWTYDDTHHWEECACGEEQNRAAHSYSGDTDTSCDCGYTRTIETHTHEWGDWTANGNGTHTRTCTIDANHTETADCAAFTYANVEGQTYHNILCECMDVLGTEAHTMSEWVRDGEFDRRQCTKNCDYYEEREHTHDWSDYTSNGNGMHIRKCTAKGCTSQQTSTCGGRATCHELAFCPDCKTTYGEYDQKNHSGGTEVRNAKDATETENGYTGDTYCLGCETLLNEGSIIYATGSGDGDDDTHTHNYSYYNYDGTNHWKMCHCGQGQAGSVKPHSLVTTGASTGHFEECTVCNYYSDVEAHVYSDDSDAYCNECGYRRHVHDYSTAATCSSPAKCGCGATTGSKDPTNHVGGTEIRNAKEATETENGYTGDTYCKGCGAKLASGKRTNKLGFVDVKYDDDVVVKEVTFQPIKGVDISDDAEVIVKDHTATLAPVDSLVGRDVNTEYLDINDLDITIIENDVYTHPDGTEYRIGEIISINGEEYVISNWVGTGDHLSLTRLSDGASCLYNAVTNVLDFGGSLITTPGEYPFERVNIGGVTYDVVLYFADIEGSGITTYLYYNGIPVGKMRSGDYYFCEGYDPATLAAQQDDNILGRITAGDTAVADLTAGTTYNVFVVGANDISVPGYDEALYDYVTGYTPEGLAAKAEVERLKADMDAKRAALDQLDANDPNHMEVWAAWYEAETAYNEALAALLNHQKATVTQTFEVPVQFVNNPNVKYVAVHEAKTGVEHGTVTLAKDGKTLTATYAVDGFSPFIVYAFVEAEEPDIKTLSATIVDGSDDTTEAPDTSEPVESPQTSDNTVWYILIAVVAGAIAVVSVVYSKRRKSKAN